MRAACGEPRAVAAHFDRAHRPVIDLTNGCTYAFLVQLIQDLSGANLDVLADVEVDGLGFNPHGPALDTDLYVPALVTRICGTRALMIRALARVAGQAPVTGEIRRRGGSVQTLGGSSSDGRRPGSYWQAGQIDARTRSRACRCRPYSAPGAENRRLVVTGASDAIRSSVG
jgi:hypothetical protein